MEHRFKNFKVVTFLRGNIVSLGQIDTDQFIMTPDDGDTLRINVAVDASTWDGKMERKLCVAAYIDGLDILKEGSLLPKENVTLYSSHKSGLISEYGGSVDIRNWKTNDKTNPELKFSLLEDALVKHYVSGVDPTERNTIRLFVWESIKPASTREYITKGSPAVTRGLSDNVTRGASNLGGIAAGENTFTNYVQVDFENPVYLGSVNIFYKVNKKTLPKFDESMFSTVSIFNDIPRV